MKRILLVLPFMLAACDSGLTGPSKNLVPTAPSLSVSSATCTLADATTASRGFNEFGYNYCARIFNGTGSSWCLEQAPIVPGCNLGIYLPDKLVMKWNAAWDACNNLGTAEACAGAWTDNEWNGKTAGGSGAVWHYKIQWVGNCVADPTLVADGGYCVWGSYEVLMDQGIDPILLGPGHFWYAHAIPNGYGT